MTTTPIVRFREIAVGETFTCDGSKDIYLRISKRQNTGINHEVNAITIHNRYNTRCIFTASSKVRRVNKIDCRKENFYFHFHG